MSDMDIYRVLGAAVAARRKKLRLKQAEVAVKMGLTRASLANIETGRQKVMLHQLYRLAAALQLNTILDLVPAKFAFSDPSDTVNLIGGTMSDQQKALVEQLVRSVKG